MIGSTLSDRAAVSNEGTKGAALSGLNMMAARLSPGAISESSSSHLPASEASKVAIEPHDDAQGDRVGHARKDDRDRPRLPLDGNGRRGLAYQEDVGLQADQLVRERSYSIVITAAQRGYPHVAAIVQPGSASACVNAAMRRFCSGSFSSPDMTGEIGAEVRWSLFFRGTGVTSLRRGFRFPMVLVGQGVQFFIQAPANVTSLACNRRNAVGFAVVTSRA